MRPGEGLLVKETGFLVGMILKAKPRSMFVHVRGNACMTAGECRPVTQDVWKSVTEWGRERVQVGSIPCERT